jgi:iron complex transport system substrate-binding protein
VTDIDRITGDVLDAAIRMRFEAAFRIDILVDDKLLIEVKSVDRLHPAHAKQVLTYLRLTRQPVGLLINFGGATLREGFRRLVNDYNSASPSPVVRAE